VVNVPLVIRLLLQRAVDSPPWLLFASMRDSMGKVAIAG